jgi:hypothetical protein
MKMVPTTITLVGKVRWLPEDKETKQNKAKTNAVTQDEPLNQNFIPKRNINAKNKYLTNLSEDKTSTAI